VKLILTRDGPPRAWWCMARAIRSFRPRPRPPAAPSRVGADAHDGGERVSCIARVPTTFRRVARAGSSRSWAVLVAQGANWLPCDSPHSGRARKASSGSDGTGLHGLHRFRPSRRRHHTTGTRDPAVADRQSRCRPMPGRRRSVRIRSARAASRRASSAWGPRSTS